MVTQRRAWLALIVLPFALVLACDKVPLLAPTGTVISLLPQTTSVSLNSEVTIIATAIENGGQVASPGTGTGTITTRTGAGTPVHNGTLITFTTTLGRIEPSEARTHNGSVSVRLITGGASGTATITAFSGGASASTNLRVGTAAAGRISVTTSPQSLGASGGTATVFATVTDEGGSPIGGVPVTFSTDRGSVSPGTAPTDANGVATATLTTNGTAKVTATAGAQSGTATVNVNARALASFTVTPATAPAGTAVTFTVTPAANANVSNVRIDFDDGEVRDLGPITAAQPVPKVYNSTGTFTARATATDATGDTTPLTATVVISALPFTVTAAPNPGIVNFPMTFTANVPAGTAVSRYVFTFSEGGGPFTQAGPSRSHTFTTTGPKVVRVDVFGVGGALLGTGEITVLVNNPPSD